MKKRLICNDRKQHQIFIFKRLDVIKVWLFLPVILKLSELPVIHRNMKNTTTWTKESKAFTCLRGLFVCGLYLTTSEYAPFSWLQTEMQKSAWRAEVKVHECQSSEVSLSLCLPLTGQEFWEFHSELWVSPVLSQECQTERSGQPGRSSAAARLTPSDVLFCGVEFCVNMDPWAKPWFNISACRNPFDMPTSQQTPEVIGTQDTTAL